MNTLSYLEEEAIYIIREVVGQFDKPVLLFSGGKDSIVLLHLCKKAFLPGKIPFPLLHIDTGHNFPETIYLRDELVKRYQVNLHIGSVQESIDQGKVVEEKGKYASRNSLQTTTLLETIENFKFELKWNLTTLTRLHVYFNDLLAEMFEGCITGRNGISNSI